jgi:DNA-directed RNA polymerase specialized sigma24 family protein
MPRLTDPQRAMAARHRPAALALARAWRCDPHDAGGVALLALCRYATRHTGPPADFWFRARLRVWRDLAKWRARERRALAVVPIPRRVPTGWAGFAAVDARMDVATLLERLTPPTRAAAWLVWAEGHAPAEAARRLGIAHSTLTRRLDAARATLTGTRPDG